MRNIKKGIKRLDSLDEALKKDIKDWAIEARQWTKYKKVRQLKHDILKNTEKLDISSIMLKKTWKVKQSRHNSNKKHKKVR